MDAEDTSPANSHRLLEQRESQRLLEQRDTSASASKASAAESRVVDEENSQAEAADGTAGTALPTANAGVKVLASAPHHQYHTIIALPPSKVPLCLGHSWPALQCLQLP